MLFITVVIFATFEPRNAPWRRGGRPRKRGAATGTWRAERLVTLEPLKVANSRPARNSLRHSRAAVLHQGRALAGTMPTYIDSNGEGDGQVEAAAAGWQRLRLGSPRGAPRAGVSVPRSRPLPRLSRRAASCVPGAQVTWWRGSTARRRAVRWHTGRTCSGPSCRSCTCSPSAAAM